MHQIVSQGKQSYAQATQEEGTYYSDPGPGTLEIS